MKIVEIRVTADMFLTILKAHNPEPGFTVTVPEAVQHLRLIKAEAIPEKLIFERSFPILLLTVEAPEDWDTTLLLLTHN